MRNELKHKNLMLLEVKIDQLQNDISNKDTTIGFLELQHTTPDSAKSLQQLTKEKLLLTKELKAKVIHRMLIVNLYLCVCRYKRS